MKKSTARDMERVCRIKEVIGELNISSDMMRAQLGLTDKEMHNLEFGYPVSDTVLNKFSETYNVKL